MKYKHLSIEEREKIQKMMWQKKSLRTIAQQLGRSHTSLSREIKRHNPQQPQRYTPRLAQERAEERKRSRGRKERLKNQNVRAYVKAKLKENWSPEQISGCIKRDIHESISYEAIYQYIYALVHRRGYGILRKGETDLRGYLKRRHRRRVVKGMRKCQRVLKHKGISIEQRPKWIEARKSIGHWEGDSMVSRKSKVALNTLVERKTGYVFITKIKNGTAAETGRAVISRLGRLPEEFRKTLTLDNGSENACYEMLQNVLGILCFFCHPYAYFERGTNENTNGLVRRYFPKGTDFSLIPDEQIKEIEAALNNRPRKRLGWRTPLQMMGGAFGG